MIVTLKDYPELLNAVRAVAPRYRKHKAIVSDCGTTYTAHGSYWDSGSRESAFTVNQYGQVSAIPAPTAPPQFGGGEPITVDIPENGYIVVVGTFRGKTATAKIYIGPQS